MSHPPATPMSEADFHAFVQGARWTMRERMDANQKEFRLNDYKRFDWSPWRGELVFSEGGVPKVLAKIQVVGSHATKSTGWVWSWANPAFPAPIRQAVLKPKAWGEERVVLRLIQPKWLATESDAWGMTAVAHQLNDAKGAFRCPSADGFTYMIFTELRAVSDRRSIFGARTCAHVLEEGEPIRLVSREADGEVLAVCGGENDGPETSRDLPLDKLLALDPSLELLADLPDGWAAVRESADQDWTPTKPE